MKKLTLLLAMAVLLGSCQKEKELGDQKVLLSVNPELKIENTTKAVVDGTTIASKQIGVQITNTLGTLLYLGSSDNLLLTKAGSWGLSTQTFLTNTDAKIYAYYPYSATDFSGTGETAILKITIPSSQTVDEQKDYLFTAQDKTEYGTGSAINNSNGGVNLKLFHALSQVAFVVYKENYSGTGNITEIKITDATATSNLKITKDGTNDLQMLVKNGFISGGDKSASLTRSLSTDISLTSDPGIVASELKTKINGYILLAPCTIVRNNITLSLTIDGKTYNATLSAGADCIFDAGEQTIFKIKLSGTAISVTGVVVADWTSVYEGEVVIQ